METSQYVTEENCNEVLKDGIVLQLSTTAEGVVGQLVKRLKSDNPQEKEEAIKLIKKETMDNTVAKLFCDKDGELICSSISINI